MATLDAFRLDRRVAIVTGAWSGFGAAIMRLFAQAGARVAYTALYLPSDASSWVTGACLMLEGGLTAG